MVAVPTAGGAHGRAEDGRLDLSARQLVPLSEQLEVHVGRERRLRRDERAPDASAVVGAGLRELYPELETTLRG